MGEREVRSRLSICQKILKYLGANPTAGAAAAAPRPGNYTFSPVTVMATETMRAISLGVIAPVFLCA